MKAFWKYLMTAVVSFVLGWSVHWQAARSVPVVIKEVPAVPLQGGALQLASGGDPDAEPAQPMPAGSKPLHVGGFVVKPNKKTLAGVGGGEGLPPAKDGAMDGLLIDCPPVEVRYTLYRDLDGQEYMRVSSPDGEVISGRDAIVEAAKVRPEMPWAFGVGIAADGRYGVRVDRDFNWAPLRASLQLQQAEDGRHVDPSAWVILRF